MPKRIALQKPRQRRRTFFREWREHRGLTQEQLAGRLDTSVASISRIESGTQPYTQDVLEALAEALMTDPASLLMRNPADPDAIWSIWDQAKSGERQLIEELARSVIKTGTKG
jgi:transcriptional regulator with XRE-family HTH domain